MSAIDLSPDLRWLFLFAHPDDELAVAVMMRRLTIAGAKVSAAWLHSTPTRRSESEAAGKLIGLKGELTFFENPDGGFIDDLHRLKMDVEKALAAAGPDRVVCAAFEQGHLDHDALNYAVAKSFQGTIVEFPEYWPYTPAVSSMNRFADPCGEEILTLSDEERAWKKNLARCYPSQGIRGYIGWFELWSMIRLNPARLVRTERVRIQAPIDYAETVHSGRARNRVLRSQEWSRWVGALATYESGLSALH